MCCAVLCDEIARDLEDRIGMEEGWREDGGGDRGGDMIRIYGKLKIIYRYVLMYLILIKNVQLR